MRRPKGLITSVFVLSFVALATLPAHAQTQLSADLIEKIDEDLVWSADLPRDDFVVTVYQGKEVGVYSDSTYDDEDGNGQREPV